MVAKPGKVRMQTYYTVVYEQPHKRTGEMVRRVSSYVENPAWFRGHIERRGGNILSVSGPRQVETIPVSF